MHRGRPSLARDTYNIPLAAGSTRSVGLSQTPSSTLSLLQESIAEADATVFPLPVPGSVDVSVAEGEIMVKTPTFEYYGFVVYMVSMAAFVVYLAWAYLPDSALETIGISYYPDRYWALALPAWWLTAVGFILLFNVATNMYNTPSLSSIDNITDLHSNIDDITDVNGFVCDEIGGIPPISDLPITLANKCLYH
ncbi:hypothetical protein IW140_000508 [Coemansia sp. RSA 1813]|nr:hypothetical protein LPJ74_000072 [Coemansia sp. RSA 1843]KAJ2092633.1 hypothetical protein IW138_001071 [Coemansia sp. RSA 986]KAJ2572745.1 hypothetical protein IW140_000508 [Coemansia sp. RSA 1813]